jgi:hypothetical protein
MGIATQALISSGGRLQVAFDRLLARFFSEDPACLVRKRPYGMALLFQTGLPRGFGWIDHRLLRDGYLLHCSPEALALYVFLVCAADAQGLSYYSESRIAQLLRLDPPTLRQARRQLMELGLITYQNPLYQLLSLEDDGPAGSPPRPSRDDEPEPQPPFPSASRPGGCRSKPPSNGSCNKAEVAPRDRL